jgi:hypothetical protein
MGYGSRAMELLQNYYENKILDLSDAKDREILEEIESTQDDELDLLAEKIGMFV